MARTRVQHWCVRQKTATWYGIVVLGCIGAMLSASPFLRRRSPVFSDSFRLARWQEEVQRLLRCNASIDAADSRVTPSGAPTGLTPLMWAVRMGHARVAHFLLAHGAAVDAKDAIGRQPLRHAATSSSIDGLRLLVEFKAAVDARDAKGWSALGRAACRGHEPAVATLLAAGATPASTMVARARARGHFPIATLLEAALRRRNKNLLFQVTDCTEPGWLERRAKGKGVDKRTLENVNLALALRAGRGGGGAQARGGSDLCASRLDAASGQGV